MFQLIRPSAITNCRPLSRRRHSSACLFSACLSRLLSYYGARVRVRYGEEMRSSRNLCGSVDRFRLGERERADATAEGRTAPSRLSLFFCTGASRPGSHKCNLTTQ
ncbi:hypothetical protein BCR39DRAFT_514647 [Naematelia encephala]|uniref:Uncharacterized protein n=1 Tax=Naematelia encephala TaxID=71784 RepID=A0A1Y2BJJ7_9TREE|nr:hypothetical protein BCR39DRAFT_514647 [Naematelia encephala]